MWDRKTCGFLPSVTTVWLSEATKIEFFFCLIYLHHFGSACLQNRHVILSVTFPSVRHLCAERRRWNCHPVDAHLSHWQNFPSDLWSRQASVARSPSSAASAAPNLIWHLARLHLHVWLLSLFEALARDASQAVTSAARGEFVSTAHFRSPSAEFPSSRGAKYVFVGKRRPCSFLSGFAFFFFFPLAGDIWLITRNHLSA